MEETKFEFHQGPLTLCHSTPPKNPPPIITVIKKDVYKYYTCVLPLVRLGAKKQGTCGFSLLAYSGLMSWESSLSKKQKQQQLTQTCCEFFATLRSRLCYQHIIDDSGENQTIHRRPQCQKRSISKSIKISSRYISAIPIHPVEGLRIPCIPIRGFSEGPGPNRSIHISIHHHLERNCPHHNEMGHKWHVFKTTIKD